MATTVAPVINASPVIPAPQPHVVDFGNGRYSKIAWEYYRDAQRLLKLDDIVAEKAAKSFIADWGRANATVDSIGIGKINGHGLATLREVSKAKGVHMTPALSIAKLMVALDDARKLGVEEFSQLKLNQRLADWLKS